MATTNTAAAARTKRQAAIEREVAKLHRAIETLEAEAGRLSDQDDADEQDATEAADLVRGFCWWTRPEPCTITRGIAARWAAVRS